MNNNFDATVGAPDLPCPRCEGEGVIHTGIDEVPTEQCRKCDGSGIAHIDAKLPAAAPADLSGLQTFKMAKLEMGHPSHYQGDFVRLADVQAALSKAAATAPVAPSDVKPWKDRIDSEGEYTTAEGVASGVNARIMARDAEIADLRAQLAAHPSPAPAEAAGWISNVVRDIAELPDRDSPTGQPDMMLVTVNELHDIITRHAPAAPAERAKEGQQDQAVDEHKAGQQENAEFTEWWEREQACPEHGLITENAAHAAWQERGRRCRAQRTTIEESNSAKGTTPAAPTEHVEIPRELIDRVHERLLKAQIFPLASELRKAAGQQDSAQPGGDV